MAEVIGRGRLKVYVGMAAGVGKTYTMLEEGHERLARGRGRRHRLARVPRARRDRRHGGGARGGPAPRGRPPRDHAARDGHPAVIARRPEVALVDELAHTNAPGSPHREALLRRRGPAPGRDRRDLDGQRPAPGEPQRPRLRADRGAGARDDPRRRAARRRRGRARGPHPRGAPGAPSRGQGLPGRAGRDGPAQLLHHRQPRDPARGRPPGGRGSGRRAHAPRPPAPRPTATSPLRSPIG